MVFGAGYKFAAFFRYYEGVLRADHADIFYRLLGLECDGHILFERFIEAVGYCGEFVYVKSYAVAEEFYGRFTLFP
jgi:hypothetical protein